MLTSSIRSIKFAFQSFGRNFWLSLITVSMLVLTLVTVNLLLVLQIVAGKAVAFAEERIEVSVYFHPTTTDDRIRGASGYLQGLPQVRDVQVITADEALARFKERHAADATILAALDEVGGSPFGPTLVIKAKSAGDIPLILDTLENPQFRDDIREKDFSSYEDIVSRIKATTDRVRAFGLGLAAVFLLIAILIVFNTVRIALFVHREEIAIMKLVGATNAFVRSPFLIECFLYSLFAVGIVAGIVFPAAAVIDPSLTLFFGGESVGLLAYFQKNWLAVFGIQLAALTAINVVSTVLAMRKYLKV